MIDLSEYHLKEEYREVLEHLSDDDKVRVAIENYSFDELKDIVIYYDLQDNPLLRTLGFEKYGKSSFDACEYARDIIKGRWIEAEDTIKTDSEYVACWYAIEVIKGRWLEAEEYIKKDPEAAFYYAQYVIKGRWHEAEDIIKTDLEWAYAYSVEVIQGRFPEAEEYIKNDPKWAKNYALDVMNDLNFLDNN